MLPNILEIADNHLLTILPKSREREQVLCKCPFCSEDSKPNKNNKYYLSINQDKNMFKCWFCGESGGVIRFTALLEGVTEQEVSARYRNPNRKIIHPAERLTRTQKRLMGIAREPDWLAMKKRDLDYYLRTLDLIWEEWTGFIENELKEAYRLVVYGIHFMKYQEYVDEIRNREKEIQEILLSPVLELYSEQEKPDWAIQIEEETQRFMIGREALSTVRHDVGA